MARIRTIKPEFWTDSKTGKLSDRAKLIFLGILNLCDDYGVLEFDPEEWKVRILPYNSGSPTVAVIPFFLDEILPSGLIIPFVLREEDGSVRQYIFVQSFSKHQVVNKPSRPLIEGWKKTDTPNTYAKRNGIDIDTSLSVLSTSLQEASHTTTVLLPFRKEGKGKEEEGKGKDKKVTAASETEPFLRAPAHEASTDSAAAEEILEKEKTETKPKNPAVEIITAFDASRVAAFGENQARPYPNQADLLVAKSWLDSGIPIGEIIDVFDYGFGRKSSEDAEPPASLKYFDNAVREQHKRQTQSGTTAANGNQSHEAPHKNSELNRWASRLKGFKSQDFWLEAWGPKPTEKHHEIPIKDHPELGEFIEKLKDKSTRKQPKNDALTLPEKIVERFVRLGIRHWPDSNKTNNGGQLERQAMEVLKRSGPDLDDRIVELMAKVFDREFGALTSAGVTDRPASMRGLTNAISCAINDAKGAGSAEDVSDE